MRYATGGGCDARGRQRREAVRLRAAEWFEQGLAQAEIARRLQVTPMSVSRWHAAWVAEGVAGLASRGSGGDPPRLTEAQVLRLLGELVRGPLVHGWDDQRWTLARIRQVIMRRFGVSYTLPGVWYLLRRAGWSWQAPARRAAERDQPAIAAWAAQEWPHIKAPRPGRTRGSASPTSADQA